MDLGLESSHTAQILRELLKAKGNRWKGTCGDLLQALKSKSVELWHLRQAAGIATGIGKQAPQGCPSNPQGMGRGCAVLHGGRQNDGAIRAAANSGGIGFSKPPMPPIEATNAT